MTGHPVRSSPRLQAGLSLIGLLIGLLLSILAIIATLSMYRFTIDASANAAGAARRNGQWAAALEAARMELQQAGYGIERSAGTAEASLLFVSAEGEEPARIVWRYRPDGVTDTCAGLELVHTGDDRGLYWLSPKSCSDASATTWAADETRALATGTAFFRQSDRSGTTLTETGVPDLTGAYFQFEGSCTLPYAQQTYNAGETQALAQRVVLRAADDEDLLVACLSNIAIGQSTVTTEDEGDATP